MSKLPKHMTNGQKAAFKRDFTQTFEDVESSEIDAEALFNWATTTGAFYDWFYTRFEKLCKARVENFGLLGLDSLERTYKPMFLEWAYYQIIPCNYADFLNGLTKDSVYLNCHEAGDMIYDYYLTQFKESVKAP